MTAAARRTPSARGERVASRRPMTSRSDRGSGSDSQNHVGGVVTLGERPVTCACADEHLLGHRRPEVLGQEERIAFGLLRQEAHERRRGRRQREHAGHHLADVVRGQAVERHPNGSLDGKQTVEHGRPLLAAVRPEHDERHAGERPACQVFEERARQFVGPLQVVHHEERRHGRGVGRERVNEGAEEPIARGRLRQRRRCVAPVLTWHTGQCGFIRRQQRAAVADDPLRDDGATRHAVVRDVLEQRAQRRERWLRRRADAGRHFLVSCDHPGSDLERDAGLADTALAPEQDQAALPLRQAACAGVDLVEHRLPADERRAVEIRARARQLRVPGWRGDLQALQRGRDVMRVPDTVAWVLRDQAPHQLIELVRYAVDDGGWRRGGGAEVLSHHLAVGAGERRPAGDQQVHHAAEGIEVRPRIEQLAVDLLGRHEQA